MDEKCLKDDDTKLSILYINILSLFSFNLSFILQLNPALINSLSPKQTSLPPYPSPSSTFLFFPFYLPPSQWPQIIRIHIHIHDRSHRNLTETSLQRNETKRIQTNLLRRIELNQIQTNRNQRNRTASNQSLLGKKYNKTKSIKSSLRSYQE